MGLIDRILSLFIRKNRDNQNSTQNSTRKHNHRQTGVENKKAGNTTSLFILS